MQSAPVPDNEAKRVEALVRYNILDTEFEEAYDELAQLASSICRTPISLISLIDPERQWFKARVGLEVAEMSREIAFCAHAILQDDIMVVPDALKDARFFDNPLVVSDPRIRFYAGAPLVSPDGLAMGTLCVIDSTPRNLDDVQLQALRVLAKQVINLMQFRITFRQMQTVARQLNDVNATRNKFFHILAHDLRAPFNGIIGFSEMLVAGLDSPAQSDLREMAEGVLKSGESALQLLNNLLEWAMSQSGRIELNALILDVDELLDEVIDLVSLSSSRKSIALLREGSVGSTVFADRSMLFSVLQNLLSNAIKFTPQGGSIAVAVTERDDAVEFSVRDTGVGMTATKIDALFEPGSGCSTAGTAGEEGSGIGLLLCRQFVEMNGGRISVSSTPGQGSTFTFTMPRPGPTARTGSD